MKERILAGSQAMGLALDAAAAEKMAEYWALVEEANRTLNLTRIQEPGLVCADHFLDSLAPLLKGEAWLPRGASLLDVGSGAGFPGVPLALARPDLIVTLIDARRKKMDFAAAALRAIGREDIRALHIRAQDVGERFDVLTARAVTALPALCLLALPLLVPGGIAILWKGPAADGEWEEAQSALSKHRAKLFPPFRYEIPGMERDRRLVLLKKSAM